MIRIHCDNCEKGFNFGNVPQFCPFCGSDKIGRDVRRQRKTALMLIDEYKEITKRMEEFAQEYVKATQRVKEIRHELASYKCKGIITAEEIPYKKNENLMSFVKRKIEEEKNLN